MKQTKQQARIERDSILRALKIAVVEGATYRYAHLVALATEAGATDEDIDVVVTQAIQALLTGAEQPVTARELAHDWPVASSRA